jgi:hypothetical protein
VLGLQRADADLWSAPLHQNLDLMWPSMHSRPSKGPTSYLTFLLRCQIARAELATQTSQVSIGVLNARRAYHPSGTNRQMCASEFHFLCLLCAWPMPMSMASGSIRAVKANLSGYKVFRKSALDVTQLWDRTDIPPGDLKCHLPSCRHDSCTTPSYAIPVPVTSPISAIKV